MSNLNDFIINNNILVKYIGAGGDVIIPDNINIIGDSAFMGNKSVTRVTLPKFLRVIKNDAFRDCYNLKEVVMFDFVTDIERGAFACCKSLMIPHIPSSIKRIGDYAFEFCLGSEEVIEIPKRAKFVGGRAFSTINPIYIKADRPFILGYDSKILATKYFLSQYAERKTDEEQLSVYLPLIKFNWKRYLIEFAYFAPFQVFCVEQNLFTLRHLEFLVDNTTGDARDMLLGHKKRLEALRYLPDFQRPMNAEPPMVADKYLAKAYAKKEWIFRRLPNHTYEIMDYVGEKEDITIPTAIGDILVTSIGYMAFKDNHIIKSVRIPDSVTNIEQCVFINCSKLESVTLPKNVDFLMSVFDSCENLKKINMPNGKIEKIMWGFSNCKRLKHISIPYGVKKIEFSFFRCNNLEIIDIPESVTEIDSDILSSSNNVKHLVIPIRLVDKLSFDKVYRNLKIYCKGTKEEFQKLKKNPPKNHWGKDCFCYLYSDEKPTTPGKFWHYVDGIPTKW